MRNIRFFSVSLIVIILLAASVGCAGTSDYLPLSVNNIWSYTNWEKAEAPPPSGVTSISDFSIQSYPGTKGWNTTFYNWPSEMKVVDTQIINGVSTYIWDHGWGNVYALANASDGIRCYAVNGTTLSTVQYFLKLPATKGATWTFTGPDGPMFQATVESLTDTIESASGRFTNCVRLKFAYHTGTYALGVGAAALSGNYDLVWFAKSYGIVREESYEGASLVISTTLDSFQLNYTDSTPPVTPALVDDGALSYGNALHVKIASDDPESGIAGYFVAVSTTPDESGILEDAIWDNIGVRSDFNTPGIPSLVDGQTYYFLVTAINNAGLLSDLAVTDGIQVSLTPPGADLFPLQINNYWSYDVSAGYYTDYPGHVAILSSTQVSSVKQFDVETALDFQRPTTSALGISGAGLSRYKLNGTALAPIQLLLALPATLNATWSWADATSSTYSTILSTTEQVTVPAGTFTNCVLVKSYNSLDTKKDDYAWYAPGIGVVKAETQQLKNGQRETIETCELNGWHLFTGPPDTTPPTKPIVTASSTLFYGTDIAAGWRSSDTESGIALYQAAISTTTTDSGIVPGTSWQSFGTSTSGILEDMPLQVGTTYYVIVRAMNASGLWSPVGASAGFKVDKPIGSIVITPSDISIAVKGKQQFTAAVTDTDGLPVTGKKLTWSVSTGGGSISQTGMFVAGSTVGDYTVSAALVGSGVSGSANVKLLPGTASKVVISPSTLTIPCAETQVFSATVYDAYKNIVPNTTVTWSLKKNSKVGQIDPTTGVFIAGSTPGTYASAIIATYGKAKGTASVKVTAPPPSDVKIFLGTVEITDSISLAAGSKPTFTSKAYDKLGRQIAGLKFTYAAQGTAGTISTKGIFTTSKVAGATGIIAAQALIDGLPSGAIGVAEVSIVPGSPSKVLVLPAANTLAVGQTYQYQCSVYDAYSNLISEPQVTWSRTLSSVGTITPTCFFTAGTKLGTFKNAIKAVTVVSKKVGYGTVTVVAY